MIKEGPRKVQEILTVVVYKYRLYKHPAKWFTDSQGRLKDYIAFMFHLRVSFHPLVSYCLRYNTGQTSIPRGVWLKAGLRVPVQDMAIAPVTCFTAVFARMTVYINERSWPYWQM